MPGRDRTIQRAEVAVVAFVVTTAFLLATTVALRRSTSPAAASDLPRVYTAVVTPVSSDPVTAAVIPALEEHQQAQLVAWYAGEDRARAEEAARVEAEQAAARAAAAAAAPRPVAVAAPVTGSCCTHTDAWWSGVAQCEQGGRNDPYFGYFSFMDGSAGGKSWSEQVAMGNALLNRVGHEVGPWAAACVAAGYRASPGG